MTYRSKILEILLWSFSAIGLLFLMWLLIGGIVIKRKLDNNLESTNAVVIDHFYSIRQTNYFSYNFYVDTVLYEGRGWYYPESDSFGVGDNIEVVYCSIDPSNNEPQREYRSYSIFKP